MNKLNIDEFLNELELTLKDLKKILADGEKLVKHVYAEKGYSSNKKKISDKSNNQEKIYMKYTSPDIKRFKAILKRNNLKVPQTAELLHVSATTVYNWFYETTNPNGKINKKYFDLLSENGYK